MTVTKQRIPIDTAERLARAVAASLFDADTVERWDIAGSIRRGKESVSDIELVCQAKRIPTNPDIFGEPQDVDVPLERRINILLEAGRLEPRKKQDGTVTMGPKCKYLWFYPDPNSWKAVPVDLFIVHDPAQYGLILAIRTGDQAFSRRLVSRRRPLGDGFLPRGWSVKGGWLCNEKGEQIPTPTEEALFEAIGLPYIPPEERDVFAANWNGGAR